MLLFFVILYLLATVLIGWWSARFVHNTQDFVIAGRRMPLIVVASGLFATWFGSETVMGASSEFVEHGLIGVIEDPFGAALCLFLIGVFIAKPLYKLNLLTFSDYFQERFSQRTELISAIMMVPSYFGWIAAQLVALSIILAVLVKATIGIEISLVLGIAICACIVMFYTYIGGMWAVSITDFVQTLMIIAGLVVLLFSVMNDAGGFQKVINNTPDGFFRFLPHNTTMDWVHWIAAWITIGLGSIPQQDVFQRVMSAKSEKTAIYAAFVSAFMYLSIAFMPLMIGLAGKQMYPELLKDTQMLLPQMVLLHGNLFLQIMFFGALLSAILSTTSGAILAPATVIGENIIKPQFPDFTDAQVLRSMRLSVVAVTIVSSILASLNTDIYDLVSQSSALSLVSLFVPLVAGLYWKKASDLGALLSMSMGMFVWIYAEIASSSIPSIMLGFAASITGMVLGTMIKPHEPQEV